MKYLTILFLLGVMLSAKEKYTSVADRIHKEVQKTEERKPESEKILESIKVEPYQDIMNEVYGGSNEQEKED